MAIKQEIVPNQKYMLKVDNLVKHYPIRGGLLRRVVNSVKAVDGVSFFIRHGETFSLVGESGCGKTTLGRTILRLTKATSGKVYFEGEDLFNLDSSEMRQKRCEMQIVFQDPFGSLNPRMTVGDIIGEPLIVHEIVSRNEVQNRVKEILEVVGLSDYHMSRYPHEFSGGQRQRIGIARALALNSKFIVCDEPVSALDVSIQSQILNLLADLQDEFGLTYLFITHDLSVVKHVSDRVAVMYLGKIVEMADKHELYSSPIHPYTQALLSAVPVPNPEAKRNRVVLEGDVPSPLNPPSGCRFHTRCIYATEKCKVEEPIWQEIKPDHFVACHEAENILKGQL